MNWDVFFESAAGTFLDVMTWVALSLLVLEILNLFTKEKIYKAIENGKKSQVGVGALLGVLPGCGGALMLVPLYNERKISLAAITAGFIATFGDAAFIILATDPMLFLNLLWIGFLTAIVFGYFLEFSGLGNWFQKRIDSKPNIKIKNIENNTTWSEEKKLLPHYFIIFDRLYAPFIVFSFSFFLFPGTIMSLVPAWENNIWIHISEWIGCFVTLMIIIIYTIRKIIMKWYVSWTYRDHPHDHPNKSIAIKENRSDEIRHTIYDVYTNVLFITTWVFAGLFIFNVLNYYASDALDFFFKLGKGSVGVLIGVAIGLLPGCGPQIAFAKFFLGSDITNYTLATLTGNSINQDGDAAFTLMATEPKTFATMRMLNLIPALIVGYTVLGVEIFLTG